MRAKNTDEPSQPPAVGREGTRGQTTLDFAIGASVFLAVLLFVFLFIPGIVSPFTESAQDQTVSSNRVADQLATGVLASPSEPYVLDSACTVRFFQGSPPGDCPYPAGPLDEQVGADTSYQNVNVSLRGNRTAPGRDKEVMCWDSTGVERGVVASSDTECDTQFERGDRTPTTQPSVTSVRVVSIAGRDVTLFVEMW